VIISVYLSVGLLAGLHKKLKADLTEISGKIRLGPA